MLYWKVLTKSFKAKEEIKMKRVICVLAIVFACLTLFIPTSYSVTNQELQKQINDLREALNNHVANCGNNNAQFKKDMESALSLLEKAMQQVDTSASNIQLVQKAVDDQSRIVLAVQKKQGEQDANVKNIQTQYVNLESKVDASNRNQKVIAVQDLFAKKQEALEKGQYALAEKYDAAIDAATKEVRRKNQVVRSSDISANVARTRERAKQDSLKTEAIISQALTTAGLREEDRELLCLYDIYSQGSSLGQYKRYLKEIDQEAKFTQFEQVARQLTQAGIFKPGIVRIRLGENSGTVVADPLDMPRICSRMIANYKEKRLTKLGEPYVTKVSQKDPPRTAYRIQRKGADLDGFYTKIGRSGRDDRD